MDSVLPLGIIAAMRPDDLSIVDWRFWLWASQTLAGVGGVCFVIGTWGLLVWPVSFSR